VNTSPQKKLSVYASQQEIVSTPKPAEPSKLATFDTKIIENPNSDDYPDYPLKYKPKKKQKKVVNIVIVSQNSNKKKNQQKSSKQKEESDDDSFTFFNKTDLYRLVNSYMHAVNDLDDVQKLFTDLPKSDSPYWIFAGEAKNIADEIKNSHDRTVKMKTYYLEKLNKFISLRDELTSKFFPFPFPFSSNIVHNFAIDVMYSLISTTPSNDTDRVNANTEKYRAFGYRGKPIDLEKLFNEAENETTEAPSAAGAGFGGLDLGGMVGGFLGGFAVSNSEHQQQQEEKRHERSVEFRPNEKLHRRLKRSATDHLFKDTKSYEMLAKYFESRLEMNFLSYQIYSRYGLDLPNADAHPNDLIIKALREITKFLDFESNQAPEKRGKISFRGVSDFKLKDLLRAYNLIGQQTNTIYTEMKKTMFLFFKSHNDPLYDSVHTRYWIHSLSDEMGLRSNQSEGIWNSSAPRWVPNHNTMYEKLKKFNDLDIKEKNLWKEFMVKFGDKFYQEDFTSLDYQLEEQAEQLLESIGMETYKEKFPERFAMLSTHEGIMQEMQNLFNYLRGNVPSLGLYHDEDTVMGSSLQQFKRIKPCAIENIMKIFQLPVNYSYVQSTGPMPEQKMICDDGTISGLYSIYKKYAT
jgi:hypothetical protein